MKKLVMAFLIAAVIGAVHAAPVEVTACPFLMESNTDYVVTQDLACDTFPGTFVDLSNSPVNSSVNIGGHTIDVLFTNFVGDFGTYYDIEVYGGSAINCGTDGGGCIQWGGSGEGILHVHDMNFSTTGNFITSSLNNQPGIQKLENINVTQDTGNLLTGWFENLSVINTTAASIDSINSAVFAVDCGNYFLDPFRHSGYDAGSTFGGTTTVTLLDADIDPLTECGGGCDLVTWVVLDAPPAPITNITNMTDLLIEFKYNKNGTTEVFDENKVKIFTNRTLDEGCGFIGDYLAAIDSGGNDVKSVKIDRRICSNTALLSTLPVISGLSVTEINKNFAFYAVKKPGLNDKNEKYKN